MSCVSTTDRFRRVMTPLPFMREVRLSCVLHIAILGVVCAVAAGPLAAQTEATERPTPTVGGAVRIWAGQLSQGLSAENWRDPLAWE